VWLAAIGVLAAAFVALVAARGRISFVELAALGTLALAATAISDPNPRFYLWSYGHRGPHGAALRAPARSPPQGSCRDPGRWDTVQMMTVAPSSFVLFFSAYLLAAALACRFTRDRPLGAWLAAFVAATGFAGPQPPLGWSNHPIATPSTCCFPLAILGTLGCATRRGASPRPWRPGFSPWSSPTSGLCERQQESVRFRFAEPSVRASCRRCAR
jgi:hypothetical protein